ncbi:MAG: putative metal-binding motif-containing protein [Bacteroidetes bacterium]|nr:putative metal-binding motif-containing protein [Bacteroidota bacterium]
MQRIVMMANAAINPAAVEVCNGIDDDCNGLSDDGLTFVTYYADADVDGYGDATVAQSTCNGAPVGYVIDATDCDDNNAAVNPAAAEVCNGIDDNCNGLTDEGLTYLTYYVDFDGDGYGDANAAGVSSCNPIVGSVTNNNDCDDNNAAINPAAQEVCDGIDNDCNGLTDDALTFVTYYADADGDGYGDATISQSTCNGAPVGYVTDATDCNDANAAVNPRCY